MGAEAALFHSRCSSKGVQLSLSAFTGFWTLLDSLNCFWDSSPLLGFSGFPGTAFVVFCMCGTVWTTCFCCSRVSVCHLLDVCVLRYPYDPMM